jgi:hypothetical protein
MTVTLDRTQTAEPRRWGSVAIADSQQQRLLTRLRRADAPVPFAELRAGGIHFPAAVVSELQLGGYMFEHVRERGRMVGVRLVEADPVFSHADSHTAHVLHPEAVTKCP